MVLVVAGCAKCGAPASSMYPDLDEEWGCRVCGARLYPGPPLPVSRRPKIKDRTTWDR